MTKMIKLFLSFTFILGLSYAQSLEGNWDLNAAIVEYTYEVREFDSVEDTLNASYSVTASWPSSAAAAAGMGYTHTLLSYDIGDTESGISIGLGYGWDVARNVEFAPRVGYNPEYEVTSFGIGFAIRF